MRRFLPLLALLLFPVLSCSPLADDKDGLADFTEIPEDWGQLVAVTKYEDTGYYELWFSNPDTGTLTHVPLYRATWQIKPDRVRTLPRGAAMSAPAHIRGGES